MRVTIAWTCSLSTLRKTPVYIKYSLLPHFLWYTCSWLYKMFLSPQKLWLHVSVLSLREAQSASTPHHYSFICSNCKDELTANVAVCILKIYNAHHHCCRCQCKKLTPEKAHYLLELCKQMNTGSICELQKQTKNSTHSAVNCMWINSLVHFPNHCWLRHVQHHTTPCHLTPNGDDSDVDRVSYFDIKRTYDDNAKLPAFKVILGKDDEDEDRIDIDGHSPFPQVGQKTSISLSLVSFARP